MIVLRYLLRQIEIVVTQLLKFGPPVIEWSIKLRPSQTSITLKGNFKMRMTNEQFILFTLIALTAAGRPAKFDGEVTVTVSDETLVSVERLETGEHKVTALGGSGVVQITVTGDADLGEGVRPLTATGVLEIVGAEAQTLALQFSEPQNI